MDKLSTPERLLPPARVLPTMEINRKTYFVDSFLRELRNVVDPRDRIVFSR
jgi:hypothetical protein